MNIFDDRVRAAIRAGWWTIGIAATVLLVQWIAYLALVAQQPACFLWLWGHGTTWPQVQTIWLEAMVAFKLGVLFLALVVVWATAWRRMLLRS